MLCFIRLKILGRQLLIKTIDTSTVIIIWEYVRLSIRHSVNYSRSDINCWVSEGIKNLQSRSFWSLTFISTTDVNRIMKSMSTLNWFKYWMSEFIIGAYQYSIANTFINAALCELLMCSLQSIDMNNTRSRKSIKILNIVVSRDISLWEKQWPDVFEFQNLWTEVQAKRDRIFLAMHQSRMRQAIIQNMSL